MEHCDVCDETPCDNPRECSEWRCRDAVIEAAKRVYHATDTKEALWASADLGRSVEALQAAEK
jgi:hypothetical protein